MHVRWTTLAVTAVVVSFGTAQLASAAVVFSDDFESGTLNNWTTSASNGLTISNGRNIVPAGGQYSAFQDSSADRMHNNIVGNGSLGAGNELTGAFTFTSYIYDPGASSTTSTRMFNEIRDYAGGTGLADGSTSASGTLGQLIAIGKFNSVTAAGEVFNGSKYQARVVLGGTAGWFNLDAAGSPNRSEGWHKFTIERLSNETTYNFYVDDVLSRTYTGATARSMDTLVIGSGTGTAVTDSNVDGILLTDTAIPEPTALAALGLLGGGLIARRRKA